MSTVYLHIGAMKSGTTHIQRVLDANRELLASRGVLFPGRRWADQVAAAEELVGRRIRGKPSTPGAWSVLVEEVLAHDGPSIISMETLARADADAARSGVASFASRRVRVILTARDLARVIPAQWQESVQNGGTATYGRFLAIASRTRSSSIPIARTLWSAQDLGRILRTWQPCVAAEDLVLVTVPPAGSDPALLWQRFCQAVDLDPSGFATDVRSNESLGAVSAELMRRVNVVAKDRDLPWHVTRVLKRRLAKQVLAGRRAEEPALALPDRYWPWAARSAQRVVDEIGGVGPVVVGDLDDLLVLATPAVGSASQARPKTTSVTSPEEIPADELLDAAVHGLIGLSQGIARAPDTASPGDDPST